MDFNLTEDQLLLQNTIRDFTKSEVEPVAEQIDYNGRLPDDMIKKLAGLGLLGMSVPVQYGGSAAGMVNSILAIEQLAYSGTGVWWIAAFNNSIPDSIAQFGSEKLKQNVLRPFCTGTAYASIQFTEEDTGSDPDALVTRARPEGDEYVVDGMKRLSTFGARDGYAVLYTRDQSGTCTAFVSSRPRETRPGIAPPPRGGPRPSARGTSAGDWHSGGPGFPAVPASRVRPVP